MASMDTKRGLAPGFYYHTSSKEPIASVKNIGDESDVNMNKSTAYGIRPIHSKHTDIRGQNNTSGERTTKAGTAWPSTR